MKKYLGLIVVAFLAAGCGTQPGTPEHPLVVTSTPSSQDCDKTPELDVCAPVVVPSTKPTPTVAPTPTTIQPGGSGEPDATESQKEAMESASTYLSFAGFSRTGLIQQLSSKAGEGFPKADAVYAVDHLKVDWNAEALEAALTYKEMGGFSKESLTQQLSSQAGDGFTKAQAAYAVKAVGLG